MFLKEMPQYAPGGNNFQMQLATLRENLESGLKATILTSNICMLDIGSQLTFWIGDPSATNVSIIANTSIEDNFCKIDLISKNPTLLKGSKPYASDLCFAIKEVISNRHLVLSGGDIFSDDAIRLWHGLVQRGSKVSVYDTTANKYLLSPVKSADELSTYIGDASKKRYIFVLSEGLLESREAITTFAIFEMKRLSNWPIFEHLDKDGNELL